MLLLIGQLERRLASTLLGIMRVVESLHEGDRRMFPGQEKNKIPNHVMHNTVFPGCRHVR